MELEEYILTTCQSSQQFSICLWDPLTLNVCKHYKNGGVINSKSLELLGRDYLIGAESGKPLVHVWQLNSQDVAKNKRLILPEPANCLAVCPKTVYLAIGIGPKVYIWEISSGKLLSIQKKHYQAVTCMKFSSNSEFILIGGLDGMLVAYRLSDMISLVTNFQIEDKPGEVKPAYTKMDHSLPINDIHIGAFEREARFCTGSSDQTCRIYNLSNGNALLVVTFDEPLTAVIFDAPCWQLFVGKESGKIAKFNLKTPPRTVTHHANASSFADFAGHEKKITCLDLNSANNLASGSDDGFVYVWDIKSGQILKKIEHKAAVTNVKFVLKLNQFFMDNFKPNVILNSLERSSTRNDDFVITKIHNVDTDISDEEEVKNEESGVSISKILEENRKLKIINKQLYTAALELLKK